VPSVDSSSKTIISKSIKPFWANKVVMQSRAFCASLRIGIRIEIFLEIVVGLFKTVLMLMKLISESKKAKALIAKRIDIKKYQVAQSAT
jgi:hypothetical protein